MLHIGPSQTIADFRAKDKDKDKQTQNTFRSFNQKTKKKRRKLENLEENLWGLCCPPQLRPLSFPPTLKPKNASPPVMMNKYSTRKESQ